MGEDRLTAAAKTGGGEAHESLGAAELLVDVIVRAEAEFEDALRKTIENRPFQAAAISLLAGWLVGRLGA